MKSNKNKLNKIKTKLIIVICLSLITLIVGIISWFYFKPIKIEDNFYDKNKIDLELKRRFGKCQITKSINSKNINDIVKKDLKSNGYIKKDNVYKKSIEINDTCDKLYKDYKKEDNAFKLKGKNSIVIESDLEYVDEGYEAKKDKKVRIINNINVKELGKQYVVYKLDDKLFDKYLIRTVEVKDTTPPSIKLNGDAEISIYVGNKYEEKGVTVVDNHDGDITSNVVINGTVDTTKENTTTLIYEITDSSGNKSQVERKIYVKKKPVTSVSGVSYSDKEVTKLTYINGILVVNKKYGLPKDYNPGINPDANAALKRMQADAKAVGLNLTLVSGYRSYSTQYNLYNNYVRINGKEKADTFSARPGYSEHQTGLAFDVGSTKGTFATTEESKWLAQNCHLYGFIIRYPYGKTHITGYIYEPWHIRYLGVETATKVKESGLTLEEYLGIN